MQTDDIGGHLLTAPGNVTITGTAWTSSTTVNTTQTIINQNAQASAYLVQLDTTTTITAGAINFQVSGDGTNWTTISAYQVVDPTSSTGAQISLPYTLVASTNKQFLIYPNGMAVRLLLSTAITGTATVTPFITPIVLTQNTALLPGSNTIGSLAANQSVNLSQVGGSALALGSTTASASIPVVLASNQTAADPCMFQAKTNAAFSSASGTFALVTGVSAKKIYVCSLSLVVPSAVSVSLAEGSSATCGTSNQAAVIGVATSGTAANGMSMIANGGLTLGNGGGTVAVTATAADYLCIFQSGTAQIAGNLTYVQQ